MHDHRSTRRTRFRQLAKPRAEADGRSVMYRSWHGLQRHDVQDLEGIQYNRLRATTNRTYLRTGYHTMRTLPVHPWNMGLRKIVSLADRGFP